MKVFYARNNKFWLMECDIEMLAHVLFSSKMERTRLEPNREDILISNEQISIFGCEYSWADGLKEIGRVGAKKCNPNNDFKELVGIEVRKLFNSKNTPYEDVVAYDIEHNPDGLYIGGKKVDIPCEIKGKSINRAIYKVTRIMEGEYFIYLKKIDVARDALIMDNARDNRVSVMCYCLPLVAPRPKVKKPKKTLDDIIASNEE